MPMNLKDALHYDPETGHWTWLVRMGSRAGVGTIAGTKDRLGYIQIKFNGKLYKGHRLAWFYVTGEWPKEELDHINRNPSDNRWCNLREASRTQNNRNTGNRKHNTSGLRGAFFCPNRKKKWDARIGLNGKSVYLGSFNTKEEAHAAYLAAARANYGEFAPLIEA